ncbi:hypothetical protein [Aurantiacibacter xanthus]|uniref:hypothetical protein n=1 Tax=Aurantiacibacter xanthus TaxID=1784712 RepID=UPI0011C234E3|nr:hypothetical protein [Aurantiacibacter xanthus]
MGSLLCSGEPVMMRALVNTVRTVIRDYVEELGVSRAELAVEVFDFAVACFTGFICVAGAMAVLP